MQVFAPIAISTLAGLSTILGCILVFINIKKENIGKFITISLSFSIAIMIGISITELIPESTLIIINNFKIIKGIFFCILVFITGVGLVLLINKHIGNKEGDLYKLGILSMIALLLHNLPEGIATFISSYKDITLGLKLSIAIMLHNIPEGISIAVPIYYATNKKTKAFLATLLSGLAEPLGAILAFVFLHKYISYNMISLTLIFVAGIMITLSIHELLPKALKYKENKYIIYGILIGIILIIINHFIM